jgi:hypothetical protein
MELGDKAVGELDVQQSQHAPSRPNVSLAYSCGGVVCYPLTPQPERLKQIPEVRTVMKVGRDLVPTLNLFSGSGPRLQSLATPTRTEVHWNHAGRARLRHAPSVNEDKSGS